MDHSLNMLKFLIANKHVTKPILEDLVQLIGAANFEDSSDDETIAERTKYIHGLLHDDTSAADIEGFTGTTETT